MKKILYIIIIAILISSCASRHYLPTSSFVSAHLKDLNGKYYMDRKDMYKYFNIVAFDYEDKNTIYHSNHKEIANISTPISINNIPLIDSVGNKFVILDFNGVDTLNITYRDNISWYKVSYKGKMKKNFFEISLQNKRFPFWPFFSLYEVDRIRIGLTKSNKVLVYNYSEHWRGALLLFYDVANGSEESILLKKLNK